MTNTAIGCGTDSSRVSGSRAFLGAQRFLGLLTLGDIPDDAGNAYGAVCAIADDTTFALQPAHLPIPAAAFQPAPIGTPKKTAHLSGTWLPLEPLIVRAGSPS